MTASVTWTPVQWGVGDLGGVFWSDVTQMGLDAGGNLVGGGIFQASTGQTFRTTTVGGDTRALDPPILTAITLVVDANRGAAVGTPAVLEIGYVPDPQPVDYSASALPWSRSEVSLGTTSLTVVETPAFTQVSIAFTTAQVTSLRAAVTGKARWNGKLALSFRVTGNNLRLFNDGASSNAAQLQTVQELFFNGLAGGPHGGPVRVLRDGRYAMPAFSGALVQDGDQPNLWVRPFDADPDDPEQEYRPRPGEGTVDDEVPNP